MMSIEVRVPTTGESVAEATVGAWLKHEGEQVEAGDALVELETDKVNLEVSAERSGVLERIERQEGDTVRPGDVLAVLAELAPGSRQPAGAPDSVPIGAVSSPRDAQPPAGDSRTERPHASPLASRMAQEHGLDLGQVSGTGTAGRVTREDVERYLARGSAAGSGGSGEMVAATGAGVTELPPPPRAEAETYRPDAQSSSLREDARPQPGERPVGEADGTPSGGAGVVAARPPALAPDAREERVRMSRRRQTIARRLLEAQQTAAMLTTFNEVDMTAVMEVRARRKDAFRERHGVGLGFMSFFTRAVVAALKAFPRLNAEIRGDEMVLKQYYDIGIAVSAEEGLVVPVVREADRKSLVEIERDIAALAERSRKNALTLDDLRGGTFTITNGGVFGSLLSTPILSPPQVGILGMHTIQQRPVARDGKVVIRPMMYLALTYDHRIVDGAEAVSFLVRIKELLEDPEALLLGG